MRRRQRLPPAGGYGVMNRTVHIPEVRELARRLLEGMNWHGVAQVEFKYDSKTGKYRLMEINPKFWGTLAISFAAGIDFPYLVYRISTGCSVPPIPYFREGCVFRWVIPNELMHVLQSSDKKTAFKQYIKDFFKPAHYNIDFSDPLPSLSLILKTFNKSLLQ